MSKYKTHFYECFQDFMNNNIKRSIFVTYPKCLNFIKYDTIIHRYSKMRIDFKKFQIVLRLGTTAKAFFTTAFNKHSQSKY